MRIAALIARYLLGLIFFVFGLNGFLHFIPMPPPEGLAGQFFGALYMSGYLTAVFFLQLLGGVILLSGFYVPLGLTILGPVLVNILLFHITMAPAGLPLALVVTILWFAVWIQFRSAFSGIFAR